MTGRDQAALNNHVCVDQVGHRDLVGRRVGVLRCGIDVPRGDLAVEIGEGPTAGNWPEAFSGSPPAGMASGANRPQL